MKKILTALPYILALIFTVGFFKIVIEPNMLMPTSPLDFLHSTNVPETPTPDLPQKIEDLLTKLCQMDHNGPQLFLDRKLVGVNFLDACREYLSPTEYQEYVDAVINAGNLVGYEFLSADPFSIIYQGQTYTSVVKKLDPENSDVESNVVIGDFPGVTNIKFGCTQGLVGELVICK